MMTDLTRAGLGGVSRREVPMRGRGLTRGLVTSTVSERARLGRDWNWLQPASPGSSPSLTHSLVVRPMLTVTGLARASCNVSRRGLLMANVSLRLLVSAGVGLCDRLDTDNTSGGDNSGATSDNLFLIEVPSSGVEVRENAPES